MRHTNNTINLIELLPFGTFPLSAARDEDEFDLPSRPSLLTAKEIDRLCEESA